MFDSLLIFFLGQTGDTATGHLANLRRLKSYYAGQTLITDHGLEILGGLHSLERVTLSACGGVTNKGVMALAALPRLQELSLEYLPGVTRAALTSFSERVRVNFET